MDTNEIAEAAEVVMAALDGEELYKAVTVLVLVSVHLAQRHNVNLADVFIMFAAGAQSGVEFLERGVH